MKPINKIMKMKVKVKMKNIGNFILNTILTMVMIVVFFYAVGIVFSLFNSFISWSVDPLISSVTFDWVTSLFTTWKSFRIGFLALLIVSIGITAVIHKAMEEERYVDQNIHYSED